MHAVRVNRLDWNLPVDGHDSCADPECFVRGDPTLTTFVFKIDEGREDPSPTLSGPSSARQRNTMHANECPTLNAGFAAAIFQRIRTCIARKPYILWFFRGVRTWIRTCNFMIFWYLQRESKTQTSLRKCAFSIQHWWSSITAFMLNGFILCLTTETTTWKKGTFVYKF